MVQGFGKERNKFEKTIEEISLQKSKKISYKKNMNEKKKVR